MHTRGRNGRLVAGVVAALVVGAGPALAKAGKGRKTQPKGGLPVWIYDPEAPANPPEPAGPARTPGSVSEAPLVLEKAPKAGPTAGIGLSPKPEKLPESPALIEAPPASPAGTNPP